MGNHPGRRLLYQGSAARRGTVGGRARLHREAALTPDQPPAQRLTGFGKKLDRAAEYRRLASAAGAMAETSPLTNVREKHLAAAARWIELAVQSETVVAAPAWPP